MRRTFTAAATIAIGLSACVYDPDLAGPPDDPDPDPSMMIGFSYVIDSALAGMPRPGARAPLDQDLGFLEDQGIELLVSLTEAGTDPVAAVRHNITVLHLPVPDFTAPSQDQLAEFARAARDAIESGHTVGVHCGAGLGRTGTFLAAYFVTEGMTASEAIAHVRMLRPGSIETAAQEQAVTSFALTPTMLERTPVTPAL